MKHRRKAIGEQVIIPQIDQQLKTKNISDVSGQLFCYQCKDKFLLETDRQTECIDDQDKFQFVKDTDNEFTEFQTSRKKLQWHFTCQLTRIYENFKDQYFRSTKSTN